MHRLCHENSNVRGDNRGIFVLLKDSRLLSYLSIYIIFCLLEIANGRLKVHSDKMQFIHEIILLLMQIKA